jgi:hypothetical protein
VVAAQAVTQEHGAGVNPVYDASAANGEIFGRTQGHSPVIRVGFDVALTVTEGSDMKAGGGVKVAGIFSLGASASGTDRLEHVSRVKFVVPLALPLDSASKEANEANRAADEAAAARFRSGR